MSNPGSKDPLDDLRRANPLPGDELSSASLARVRARVQEGFQREHPERRRLGWRGRVPLGVGLGLAAVAVIALLTGGWGPAPGPAASGRLDIGLCVDPYSAAALARRTFAFDGTVTGVAGDAVTFAVNRTFRGAGRGSITVAAPGMTGSSLTPGNGPSFSVGNRYLVAGDAGLAWGCGFSQVYDADVAEGWSRVFGTD